MCRKSIKAKCREMNFWVKVLQISFTWSSRPQKSDRRSDLLRHHNALSLMDLSSFYVIHIYKEAGYTTSVQLLACRYVAVCKRMATNKLAAVVS